MRKINGKVILIIIFWLSVIGLLVYSRFINLSWGLPYPMHPDERNMANAVQQLSCKFSIFNFQLSNLKTCFNPRFFAYGQFPLYLGYLIVYFLKFFDGDLKFPISFQEAVISLRIISAAASIINVFVLIKIIKLILKKNRSLLTILILTFSPFFIQFSHFGTTESLLMLFYSLIVYLSMRLLERPIISEVVWLALVSGLSNATKISSALFLTVPVTALILKIKNQKSKLKVINQLFSFAFCTLFFTFVFSPQSIINFQDFLGSMRYESDVATGRALVFYTRQFINAVPVWFQMTKVFPYALGWPVFILGMLGFLGGLGFKDKKINLLRFAIIVYFIPTAFLYAKWTRFMSPIFPLILTLAVLFLLKIKIKIIRNIIIFTAILPGIAYLSIYQHPDVRFQASEWIYKNIPENSYILFETANVVDIPLEVPVAEHKNYQAISFNFYDLDESLRLQSELKNHLMKADYIFIPSRRLFANHPKVKYPLLMDYYDKLFSGKLGFKEIAEFNSYPIICLPFTNKCLTFPDEQAEETWTVFDHPVIRIYKKIKSF